MKHTQCPCMAKTTRAQKKADKRRQIAEAEAAECLNPTIKEHYVKSWEEQELELHDVDTVEHAVIQAKIDDGKAIQHPNTVGGHHSETGTPPKKKKAKAFEAKPQDSSNHKESNYNMRTRQGKVENTAEEEVDLTQQDNDRSEGDSRSSEGEGSSPSDAENGEEEIPESERKLPHKREAEITKIVEDIAMEENDDAEQEMEMTPREEESAQQQEKKKMTKTPQQGEVCDEVETAEEEKHTETEVDDLIEQQPHTMAHEEAKMHAKMLVQITETLKTVKKTLGDVEKRMGKMTEKAQEAEGIGKTLVQAKMAMMQQKAIADLAEKHEKDRRKWDKEATDLRDEATELRNQNQALHTCLQQAIITSQIKNRASDTVEIMHELRSSTEASQKPAKKRKSTGGKTNATTTPKKKT